MGHLIFYAAFCDKIMRFFQLCTLTLCLPLQVSVKMVFAPAACVLLSLSPLLALGVPPIRTQPEQVHLSYPGKGFNSHRQPRQCFQLQFCFRQWVVLLDHNLLGFLTRDMRI